jgi:hypothetical protein
LALQTLCFENLSIGMIERLSKNVASSGVAGFAEVSGDRNPAKARAPISRGGHRFQPALAR